MKETTTNIPKFSGIILVVVEHLTGSGIQQDQYVFDVC